MISAQEQPSEVGTNKTGPIVKICLCGDKESDHDRRWDVASVLFSSYYPCKSCQCDSFSIDEETRKKISKSANEQWQRLRNQNELEKRIGEEETRFTPNEHPHNGEIRIESRSTN